MSVYDRWKQTVPEDDGLDLYDAIDELLGPEGRNLSDAAIARRLLELMVRDGKVPEQTLLDLLVCHYEPVIFDLAFASRRSRQGEA